MALKTAGTNLTTSLSALQWQPGGLSPTDLAAIMALITDSIGGIQPGSIADGYLYMPAKRAPQGIRINPGDWILVDNKGHPLIVPNADFAGGGSWTHS